jgi:GDP-D-mannose dehydratase
MFFNVSVYYHLKNVYHTSVVTINEESPMVSSPYTIAKLYAYHMIKYYRKAYIVLMEFFHTSPLFVKKSATMLKIIVKVILTLQVTLDTQKIMLEVCG